MIQNINSKCQDFKISLLIKLQYRPGDKLSEDVHNNCVQAHVREALNDLLDVWSSKQNNNKVKEGCGLQIKCLLWTRHTTTWLTTSGKVEES